MLKKGRDYIVKYTKNKAVGKAKMIVTGKGKYKGTISKTFRIVPDRVTAKINTFRVIEGTQLVISLSSEYSPKYYEVEIARDSRFRKTITKKKIRRNILISGTFYAYKHLKKGTYYFRIRSIAKKGYIGKYSKVRKFKGLG